MLDFLGLAPKGLSLESTKQVHSLIQKIGGKGSWTVIGTTLRVLPQYAALANATASHSLSLDDIYTPASIHPGSGILSASLAAAEWARVVGKRLIEGVVAGYETTLRVADAVGSKVHYACHSKNSSGSWVYSRPQKCQTGFRGVFPRTGEKHDVDVARFRQWV
jgi:2-methylcitrate dehydratase PrpD